MLMDYRMGGEKYMGLNSAKEFLRVLIVHKWKSKRTQCSIRYSLIQDMLIASLLLNDSAVKKDLTCQSGIVYSDIET